MSQYQKSLEYILINIKLSDNDNLYSGVYNIGIIYRSLNQYDLSLNNFQKALEWSKEKQVF